MSDHSLNQKNRYDESAETRLHTDPTAAAPAFKFRIPDHPAHRRTRRGSYREICSRLSIKLAATMLLAGASSSGADQVGLAQFSPDGRRIVTAASDGTTRVWDAKTGQPVVAPGKTDGPVVTVYFTPDGKRLATAPTDKPVRIWDAKTGQLLTGAFQEEALNLGVEKATPRLSLRVEVSGGTLVLTWPAQATEFVLEATDDLATPVWVPIPADPVTDGETLSVKVPISSGSVYFRLRQR